MKTGIFLIVMTISLLAAKKDDKLATESRSI